MRAIYRAKREVLLRGLRGGRPAPRRRRRVDVPLAGATRGGVTPRLLEQRRRARAGRLLRPGRGGLRAARARAAAGGLRAGGGRDRGRRICGVTDLPAAHRGRLRGRRRRPRRRRGGRRADRPRRGPGRRADGAPTRDGWTVNEWAKKAILLYFRVRGDGDDRGRAVRVPRQDPAQGRLGRAQRARRAAGDGPPRRLRLAGHGADAVLREHRRLGRPGDDGRHLGDRRVLRADRRRRAPVRRRRHRRRARAAAGRAGDRRGRRVPGLAGDRGRGRARRRPRRARRQRRHHRLHADHRRHRRRAGRAPRRGPAGVGGRPRHAHEVASRPATTSSRRR